MQVSIENVGKLGRKLTVRLPAQGLEDKVRTRIQEMGRSARIKGFRPGKVPTKVIEQRFGRQIRGEVLSEMIGSSFQEAVSQEKLRPAVQPAISTTGTPTNGEIEYTATFEIMPEIGKIDISGLEIAKPTASVTDPDIDQMIETLRLQRRTFVPVERAAHGGDMALFEFASMADGKRHPETGFERVGAILGSGAFLSEIENKLIGHKTGDEFTIEATFPANFRDLALAGRTANARDQGRARAGTASSRSRRDVRRELRHQGRRPRQVPRGRARESRARAQGRADGPPQGDHGGEARRCVS